MSIIEVENLKYRYPDLTDLVLDDLSFSVEKGECLGIVGENTAGKSTLCYALAGLIPHFYKGAYGGKVTVNGLVVREHEIAEIVENIGLVFENPFSQMTGAKKTVYEEVAFGLENLGLDRKEMHRRIEQYLKLLDVFGLKDKNPFDLSGGQMQRVAIASVLAMEPDVLILDEPTSQLDPQGSREVFEVIEQLTEKGMTIILVEHKMEQIAQYADRVLLLHQGRQVALDTPEKIFSRPDLKGFGVTPPVVTNISKALNVRYPDSELFPVTIEAFKRLEEAK
ncbi:energy-coupling factor transport system ATP-binding protein [Alkalibacterium putridalgicola]|uniref:ABC transporter ATP-binding protein n=1 Tax=Alkalibacterium putridalgicola TaxID=426703 RepID=A0A1H7WT51_9LACT|nr:ABC transporter ATP-binding protein [Alkalibacterium putridalgicola]GEK90152.1 ABC transporter ATP-binding protein [Alkalibacterium putridalgicola]SEM24475.1 energy-coupling factor transport system ATP-binding protein [Alkalibacterium putridalgicola]